MQPVVNKPKRSASFFTINCPDLQMYKANAYDILMDAGAKNLGIFGPTEILYSFDTYQFHDYTKYDAAQIRETQFPKDLEKAYEPGKRLCCEQ